MDFFNLKPSLFLLIFSVFSSNVYSQKGIDGFSINPKVAAYNQFSKDGGFVIGAELGLRMKDKLLYSFDHYTYGELNLFGSEQYTYYNQLGFMIGSYIGDEYARFQYQGGLTTVWGEEIAEVIHCGPGLFGPCTYKMNEVFTFGLQLKLGFKLIPSRYISIGIDLQTNINPVKTLYAPMLSLELGILRKKIQ